MLLSIAWLGLFSLTSHLVGAQTSDATPVTTPATSSATGVTVEGTLSPQSRSASTTGTQSSSASSATSTSSSSYNNSVPDVYLNVPNLSVGKIELDVDDLAANINLNAKVAGLVTLNAGVQVSVEKVNITIADVEAELELIVRLGNLVDIVKRVFESLDLNPLLITALNDVTSLVDTVVGEVEGLLGSITQGGNVLSFLIDNLGNIVQQVTTAAGDVTSSIVGDYLTNMTFTGEVLDLGNGLTQKTYSYSPLNSLVNIVFNTLGQIVQATVAKTGSSSSTTTAAGSTATTAASSSAATSTG